MTEQEGVIKYELVFATADALRNHNYAELNHWHQVFKQAGLLGQDPHRYDGLGFGNLSQRLGDTEFLITGTQTGHLDQLQPEHYALVTAVEIPQNRVTGRGPIKPSSESLTHAAIYALHPDIKFVFHAHSPDIWQSRRALGIAETAKSIPYGTPAMASEMRRLYVATGMQTSGIIAMAGHEDGVISFAASAAETGNLMMDFLHQAEGINS